MVEFRPAGLGVWFGLVLGSSFLSPPSVCSSLPSTMTWAPCPHGVRTRGKKKVSEALHHCKRQLGATQCPHCHQVERVSNHPPALTSCSPWTCTPMSGVSVLHLARHPAEQPWPRAADNLPALRLSALPPRLLQWDWGGWKWHSGQPDSIALF